MGLIVFKDENDKSLSQDEVVDIFRYEDFLKETIFKKNIGQKMLNELQNNTYNQIFISKKEVINPAKSK